MDGKRFFGTALLSGLLLLMCSPMVFAQGRYGGLGTNNNGEIGAFLNYTRLHNAGNTNFYGVGGRIGFGMTRGLQIEAEGAYDFEQNVSVNLTSTGGSFSTVTSPLHMVHFMAGPKFQVGGSGPIRVFVTAKGGLINFSNIGSFPGQVSSIPSGNTDGVFYPGGGIELFAGKLGFRVEAGDEIYFDHGANNNLRVTAGPTLRF